MNIENEMGTVVAFAQIVGSTKWAIEKIQSQFPDITLIHDDGRVVKAEFEYIASNFIVHRHDPRDCDLIICWQNDLPDCPLPIWELSKKCNFEIDIIDKNLVYIWFLEKEVAYLRKKLKGYNSINGDGKRDAYWIGLDKRMRSATNEALAEESLRADFEKSIPVNAKKLSDVGLSVTRIAAIIFGVDRPNGPQIRTIRNALRGADVRPS